MANITDAWQDTWDVDSTYAEGDYVLKDGVLSCHHHSNAECGP